MSTLTTLRSSSSLNTTNSPHLRPYSASLAERTLTRPLSTISTLSAVSIASTASSSSALTNTGSRRRRSAALLDLDLDLDDTTRSSLVRAEAVLRASEHEREVERRKARLSWRDRQVRSAHLVIEQLAATGVEDETEELDVQEQRREEFEQDRSTNPLRRFRPKRFMLRKTQSIPLDMASPPAMSRSSQDAGFSAKSPSPPRPSVARRALSSSNLLSSATETLRSPPLRPASPPQHHHYGTLPLRFSRLEPPLDPPSKFSGSSGDSIIHVVAFDGPAADKKRKGLKDRARTFSRASTDGLKTLTSRMPKRTSTRRPGVKKKPSLANLFAGLSGTNDSGASSSETKARSISFASSSSRHVVTSSGDTSGHRPSTSISSYAPSSTTSDSGPPSRKPSRLGFFRSISKRNSDGSKRTSRSTTSSGPLSPSLVSRPVSVASEGAFAAAQDRRASNATSSSNGSAADVPQAKLGWAGRLTRAVKGKNVAAKKALFEKTVTVQQAEKIAAPQSPDLTACPPTRLPLATVFPSRAEDLAPPARPPRPSKSFESSDDTTFYGHKIAPVKTRAAAIDAFVIESSAPRVRAKASVPSAKRAPVVPPNDELPRTTYQPLANERLSIGQPFDSSLLPPVPIYPAYSFPPSRRYSPDFGDVSDSSLSPAEHSGSSGWSSSPSQRCPSPARSFRSPSPARWRALLPSASAGSSPEKNERGLPQPLDASPRNSETLGSPRKLAMGPENVICMGIDDLTGNPISEVRGATTDLAELLSGLEDTYELDTSKVGASVASRRHVQRDVSDLSASLRGKLPHLESIESLRSSVSDVPLDLKELINTVDDHISEVDIPFFSIEQPPLSYNGFGDDDDSSSSGESSGEDDLAVLQARAGLSASGHLVVDNTTSRFSIVGGATQALEATATSFEGLHSTAVDAIRHMLSAPGTTLSSPGSATLQAFPLPASATLQAFRLDNIDEEQPRSTLRDSMRDALELERPTAGDKMFERIDEDVSLNALINSPSPPVSPEQVLARREALYHHHTRIGSTLSTAEGSLESCFSLVGSPSPNPPSGRPMRHSLQRYSQDRFPTKRPSHRARPISELSAASTDPASIETTNLSVAPSSRSTNLSVSSLTSSPCPVPRSGRIRMLTRAEGPLPSQPAFRFPPAKDRVKQAHPAPGRGSHSPRYVRPLVAVEPGETLPKPIRLADYVDGPIPPDTPPPSSPSISDDERRVLELDHHGAPAHATEPSTSLGCFGHIRHASDILQSVIAKESEDNLSTSPSSTHLRPLEPAYLPTSPQPMPFGPLDDSSIAFEVIVGPPEQLSGRVVELEPDESLLMSVRDEDFDLTAETNPEITRQHASFAYEAETEVHRSRIVWPDTDYSREVIAHFILPRTYHAILEFLFFSQSRWPSPPHLLRMTSFVPPAYDDPPTPPSPIVIPPPIVDFPPAPQEVVLVSKARPVRRKVLSEKPINQQVALLSRSTSSPSKKPKDQQSPFTALPPRLSAKLRGARGKLSSKSSKRVDTGFLGDNATTRRQGQFNAAMRRLEGIGAPAEQRSDSETDDTGVLEAHGEATDELTFTKTPRLSLNRPRVRRKPGITTLR
ncbi:Proteophosphoglycan ppg4 [Rhodotorula toruloides ATCC 204091]|uniref:Proteophosphoglycan ppg4 n=1 Tax=Rhodotorula toruloides TaxID=5286 RepID=A0A0K3CLL5_RHOTO|nr:Proteophosphoglycan ppg4 [Rhodotorula toruloides ATCC 204091]KAK4329959.1 Proteophosphoglycan ppg4 [Rhodotorula toruloides]PRQ71984.1 Proteophosphoglycan ppg4 [Rhodotorula toruloides]